MVSKTASWKAFLLGITYQRRPVHRRRGPRRQRQLEDGELEDVASPVSDGEGGDSSTSSAEPGGPDPVDGALEVANGDVDVDAPAQQADDGTLPQDGRATSGSSSSSNGRSSTNSSTSSTSSSSTSSTSSSSSSSTSSDSSESFADDVASGAEAATEEDPLLQDADERASQHSRTDAGSAGPDRRAAQRHGIRWGLVPFVPVTRLQNGNTVQCGYQVLCHHPHHIRPDGRQCQKTRAFAISGGEQNAVRLLKHWMLMGLRAPDSDSHKAMWSQVLDSFRNDQLPTMRELDAQEISSWHVPEVAAERASSSQPSFGADAAESASSNHPPSGSHHPLLRAQAAESASSSADPRADALTGDSAENSRPSKRARVEDSEKSSGRSA